MINGIEIAFQIKFSSPKLTSLPDENYELYSDDWWNSVATYSYSFGKI